MTTLAAAAFVAGTTALVAAVPGRDAAAAAHRIALPPVNARFDYQIGGAYPPAAGVRIVDRDRSAAPARGRYNICYVNAFQTQPGEFGWWRRHHPAELLRRGTAYVHDPGWPDEVLLDISTASRRAVVAHVVGTWSAGCARNGYDAVEPDNLDSWTRSRGLLNEADAVATATLIVRAAHRLGLAVAQKNTSELGSRGRTAIGFDFALAEECGVYRECGAYTAVYGRRVIEIEYTDNGRAVYRHACSARGRQISIILRDRDVVPRGQPGYVYAAC